MDDSAELFEAISHPIRIKILKLLEKQSSSFASLKRQLNIDSSGNLDHHLKKLGPLIETREDGLYALSGAGKEALISIAAIETWKDDERRKKGAFVKPPGIIFVLVFLEIAIAVASAIIDLKIVFPALFFRLMGYPTFFPPFFAFSWFSLLNVYTLMIALALMSATGLLTRKKWGWMLVIVEAAVLLLNGLPIFITSVLTLQTLGFYWNIWTLWLVLLPAGVLTLVLALQPSLRESIGTKYSTPMARRAFVGGALGIVSGVINVPVAEMISHSPGGGMIGLSGTMSIAGMLIVIGGVLILLRMYLLGALIIVITSSITVYSYFIIGSVIFTYLSLPLGSGSLLVGTILFALSIVSGVLASISRSKLRS